MKAVILAGGLGTRLKPFTEAIPKPLLPIGEKSILELQISRLMQYGFEDIFVATYYKADYIRSFLGDGSRFGAHVTVSRETEAPTWQTCRGFRRDARMQKRQLVVVRCRGACSHVVSFRAQPKACHGTTLLESHMVNDGGDQ